MAPPPLVKVNSRTGRTIAVADPLPGRGVMLGRDRAYIPSAEDYAADKALTDTNGSGLWVVHGNYYDLTKYAKEHPGGEVFIECTRGHDITEAFEAHHIRVDAWEELGKHKVAPPPGAPPLNPPKFSYNTAWRAIKQRIRKHLESIGNPTGDTPTITGVKHTLVVAQFLACALLAAKRKSKLLAALAGFLLVGCWGVGHGQMHRSRNGRWSWLRFAVDLTGFSSADQTVTHCLSHHLFPNMLHDVEITMTVPAGIYWLTSEAKKSPVKWHPLLFALVGAGSALNTLGSRLANRIMNRDMLRADVLVPVGLVSAMSALAGSVKTGLSLSTIMWMSYGVVFIPIGISVHHSHDEVEGRPIKWHEGEPGAKEDFALHQVITTTDHSPWASGPYLSQTLFAGLNLHTIHHFFPTVDESLHVDILNVLRTENTGGFRDAYEGGPHGGGDSRSVGELISGLFRMARDRTYEPVESP